MTHALRLAREIEQGLSVDADEDARWQRLQRQVTDELGTLADALRRHGDNAAASFREDGIVGEVTFRAHMTIAGVDDRARAKCLGLLAAFDLDVVMKSEREWGCYAEVPGLAIAQLSRIEGIAAVLVSPLGVEWCPRRAALPPYAAGSGAA